MDVFETIVSNFDHAASVLTFLDHREIAITGGYAVSHIIHRHVMVRFISKRALRRKAKAARKTAIEASPEFTWSVTKAD